MSIQLLAQFREYANNFKSYFVNRESEIDSLFYAILTKEHVLFRGKPGTGKSLLAKKFFGGIDNSKLFSIQLTAFMDESYLYGPQDINALKKGEVIHNTQNSLVDCNFAFLDEAFNASDETLSSMNELLNERTFTRNHQQEKAGLVTAVLTTNQDRTDEEKVKPVYDRILFNIEVKGLDRSGRQNLYKNVLHYQDPEFGVFPFNDLETIHNYIDSTDVNFSPVILEAFDDIVESLIIKRDIQLSDRRIVKALHFLKCRTLACNRQDVKIEDLGKLNLILCIEEDDYLEFDAIFVRVRKDLADSIGFQNEFDRYSLIVNEVINSSSNDFGMKERLLEELLEVRHTFKGKISSAQIRKVANNIESVVTNSTKLRQMGLSGRKLGDIMKELEQKPIGTIDYSDSAFESDGTTSSVLEDEVGVGNWDTLHSVAVQSGSDPVPVPAITYDNEKLGSVSKGVKSDIVDLLDFFDNK